MTPQNLEEQNSNTEDIDVGHGLGFHDYGLPVSQTNENNQYFYTRSNDGDLCIKSGSYDFSPLYGRVAFNRLRCSVYFYAAKDDTIIFNGGGITFPFLTKIHSGTVQIDGGDFYCISVFSAAIINSGTFNNDSSSESPSALMVGSNSNVTINGGTFNGPIEVSRGATLNIPFDSTAVFNSGFVNLGGTINAEKLVIASDGYPLGSNGGETACSYTDKNNLGWEYVPATNATESDSKGTLYLSDTSLTLDGSTTVNCDIVMGRTSDSDNYIGYRNGNAPTLNGGIYNGTVSGLVTINSGTFKNTVTAETSTSVITGGTFEKAVTLEYGGKITNGIFNASVTGQPNINGGTFTKTSDVTMSGSGAINGGIFRGSLSGNDPVYIAGGLFLCDLGQLSHTSTGGYFADSTSIRPQNGYSCGTIFFVDEDSTFTLLGFPDEELSQISVVWKDGSTTAATITPSKAITSVNLDTDHTGEAGQSFTLAPSDFNKNTPEAPAYLTSNALYTVTLPESISLDMIQSSGRWSLNSLVKIASDRTVTLPEGATIEFRDNNGTDAAFVSGSSNSQLQKDGSYYVYTVPGGNDTVKRLNKLHIDENGLPITKGTYSEPVAGNGVVTAYYGDGWEYVVNTVTKSHELTITEAQDLTGETNAVTAATAIKAAVTGGTYNSAIVSCLDGGTLTGAALNGSVHVTGTLDNCTISLTGSNLLTIGSDGNVQNCKITVSNHTSDSGVSIYNIGGQIGSGNTIDLGGTTLQNDSKLLLGGEGTAIKNGTIQNNGDLCSKDTAIEADVVNNGKINGSIITGKVTNGTNGTITSSILTGEQNDPPKNMHKLTITPADSVTVALPDLGVISGFDGTVYIPENQNFTVETSIQSPIWTADGISLGEDQLTARTLTLTMPTGDVTLGVAKKPGDFDPDDFIVTAPENAVEDGSTVYEVVAVKRPDCEKAYGKISIIYRDAENNIVPAPSAAGVYTYTVIVADTAEFAGGTAATGSFEVAPAIDPGPSPVPAEDSDAGAGAAIVLGTAAVGGAAYLIGTQVWMEANLPGGVIPTSRQQLAELLWTAAGKPEPAPAALYTDIAAAETEAQQAAHWCVQQGLMQDYGESFQPARYTFRPQVIKAWNQLQALQSQQ